jgi:two-component system cell cycle sensor histidine kinase/response regulator CckA
MQERCTILVADHEPFVLRIVDAVLRRVNFNVLAAASPAEVLALCRGYKRRIHLALLETPGMDRPELRDCLRRQFPAIRMLFMSGYLGGVHVAAHSFVEKPFTPSEVVQRVQGALAEPRPASGTLKAGH